MMAVAGTAEKGEHSPATPSQWTRRYEYAWTGAQADWGVRDLSMFEESGGSGV